MTWRPGKNFRVGAMRQRITVQSYTSARDDAGQAVAAWANLLTSEPARFLPVGGGTMYRGQQLQEDITAVFEVRFRDSTYDTTQQVIHDGTTYGITRVTPVDGGRRYLALLCRAVAA